MLAVQVGFFLHIKMQSDYSPKLGHVHDLLEKIQKLGRVPIRQKTASTDEAKLYKNEQRNYESAK